MNVDEKLKQIMQMSNNDVDVVGFILSNHITHGSSDGALIDLSSKRNELTQMLILWKQQHNQDLVEKIKGMKTEKSVTKIISENVELLEIRHQTSNNPRNQIIDDVLKIIKEEK